MSIRATALFLICLSCSPAAEMPRQAEPRRAAIQTIDEDAIMTVVIQELFAHAESSMVAISPVYLVAAGEFPDIRPVNRQVLTGLSGADRPLRAIASADFQAGTRAVIDAKSGKRAILFFAHVYLCAGEQKAFVIGGTYADAMNLQRYVFEVRNEHGHWRIWNYARWGGEGYAPARRGNEESHLLACRAPLGHDRSSAAEMVGSWRSDTFMTQMGSASETLCLRPDHTFTLVTKTQAGDVVMTGTYTSDGHVLSLTSSRGATSRSVIRRVDSGTLVLAPESGDERHYKRIRGAC